MVAPLEDGPTVDWHRTLSLIVALLYVGGGLWAGRQGEWVLISGYTLICLGFIWFADEVGDYVGLGPKGIFISSPTPGFLIRWAGWLLLLLPALLPLLLKLAS